MGKKKSKSPKPADPQATAAAQTSSNIGTAIANANLQNVNEFTPEGNRVFTQRDDTYTYTDPNKGQVYEIPRFDVTTTYSPEQQAIQDQNKRSQLALATAAGNQSESLTDYLGERVTTEGLPEGGDADTLAAPSYETVGAGPTYDNVQGAGDLNASYNTDFSQSRKDVEDSIFSRINPQLDRDRGALESRLASQGIGIGSQAYNDSFDELNRNATDARFQAVLAGGQEHSRLVGLEAGRAGFENQSVAQKYALDKDTTTANNSLLDKNYQNSNYATSFNNTVAQAELASNKDVFNAKNNDRAQSLQELFSLRNQPINETTALLSGSQITEPKFSNPNIGGIPTTNFAQIQQQYDSQRASNHQADQAASNGLFGQIFGGLGSLAGAFISDERVKDNIKQVGKVTSGKGKGLKLYSFNYKGDDKTQVGLIAQEVEKKNPDAVVNLPTGIKAVNYKKALHS